MARAVASAIVSAGPAERGRLCSIAYQQPADAALVPDSRHYFLGPESLNAFVEHGRSMFEFLGDTEAVAANT
jgi:hypothetical protein